MDSTITFEVCVDSVDSAVTSQSAGADRIELCAGLLEGGTTPSSGLIAEVRQNVSIKLHVMIRPRPGDFCYESDEIRVMERDISVAKDLGADGVVLGILDPRGNVNARVTAGLTALARPMKVTFHRAIDMSRDPRKSLQALIDLGVDYVLTSGARQTAIEGAPGIVRLVSAARDRIGIIAASGIRAGNVRRLIAKTSVRAIHVGLRDAFPSPMKYRNRKISMGGAKGREYTRFAVREDRLRKLIDTARRKA
jgi:copper homeostasis protein